MDKRASGYVAFELQGAGKEEWVQVSMDTAETEASLFARMALISPCGVVLTAGCEEMSWMGRL